MIQVNLFTTGNVHYKNRLALTRVALKEFYNIKDENKDKIKLYVFCNEGAKAEWSNIVNEYTDKNIETFLVLMPSDDYIEKVRMLTQSDCEYICKWDDDCFINRYVWDFMIENVSVLENPNNSVILPVWGNGVPSVDMFIEDFFDTKSTQRAHEIFIKDSISPDIWNCNFFELREIIKSFENWDYESFWKVVEDYDQTKDRNLPWYFSRVKGVHPARFSYEYNKFLYQYTLNNVDSLFDKQDYYLDRNFFTPYFCNNMFISKTKFYIDSQKEFFDHWDEGQLNTLSIKQNASPVYVRNCFGVHMAYGCTQNQKEIENLYCDNIFGKLL
jgi:hypothetical protein